MLVELLLDKISGVEGQRTTVERVEHGVYELKNRRAENKNLSRRALEYIRKHGQR
jgi:hypothetical protein